MKLNKIVFYILIPVLYSLLLFTQNYFTEPLTREDGIVENIGSIAFLGASIVFFYLFNNFNTATNFFLGKKTKKNYYFLLLALVFLFGFGEEISWGQRIFNWDTPEALATINAQQETNIHNLWLFQAYKKDGSYKNFWELLLNMDRLFSIFWLLFCVLTPLIYLYSKKGKALINYLGLPIVSLWVGGLFILNYAVYNLFDGVLLDGSFPRLEEAKEAIYALIFLVVALDFKNRLLTPVLAKG